MLLLAFLLDCYFKGNDMEGLLAGAGFWAAGLVIGAICNNVLPKWWNGLMISLRKDVKKKAALYFKDPAVRAWVQEGISIAQKMLGADKNIEKLIMAGNWLKAKIPGPLDDPIIDELIELGIEELKKPVALS